MITGGTVSSGTSTNRLEFVNTDSNNRNIPRIARRKAGGSPSTLTHATGSTGWRKHITLHTHSLGTADDDGVLSMLWELRPRHISKEDPSLHRLHEHAISLLDTSRSTPMASEAPRPASSGTPSTEQGAPSLAWTERMSQIYLDIERQCQAEESSFCLSLTIGSPRRQEVKRALR